MKLRLQVYLHDRRNIVSQFRTAYRNFIPDDALLASFAFEKFPQADPTLTTQMKSVGEAMAIGRTFKESLQKCLRSLEIGRSGLGGDGKPWRIGTEVYGDRDILPRDVISRKLSVPNAERIFFIRHALRAGFTIEEIFNLTKIDRWFLVQIKEIVDFEEELAGAKN